jgi:hypothetical protein
LQHPYETLATYIPLKHLKHLKCTLTTCILSQNSLLRSMHQGTVAVVGGKAGGLPCQGPTLLLAQRPQWLASGRGGGHHTWARQCPRRQAKHAAK